MLNPQTASRIRSKVADLIDQDLTITDADGQVLIGGEHEPGTKLNPSDLGGVEVRYGNKIVGFIILEKPVPDQDRIAPLLRSIAELVLHQTLLMEQIPNQEERLDKFVYDLLHSPISDEAVVKAEARLFKIELDKPKLAIAVYIDDPVLIGPNRDPSSDYEVTIARYKSSLNRSLESFYTTSHDHVVAYLGQNHFVILKGFNGGPIEESVANFKKSIQSFYQIVKGEIKYSTTMGVGNFAPAIAGLRQSYSEGISAIEIGSQMWDTDRVYHIDDFGVVAPLLSGVDENNIHFSRELLDRINQNGETIKTLEAYFGFDMSLTKTAESLGVHRNTLVYRLDRIAETLELDPRNFDDAVQIKLAMLYPKFVEKNAA